MLFREQSRPFDSTGNSPLNLILAEYRPLETPSDRIFIPSHGPFYTKSLIVTNGGTPLVRGVDYECILFYKEATSVSGKEVGCGIKIIRTGILNVNIDYQVVGGQFQFVFPVLKLLMENLGDNLIQPIIFNEIIGKPDTFPPSAHRHPYWKFTGWSELITPLDRILNGVYFQDHEKYRNAYDYWYSKQGQFETAFTFKVRQLQQEIENTYIAMREPLGTVRLRTGNRDMGIDREGIWYTENDKVLSFTDIDNDIGNEFSLSEEIVYPQPDNILLDEQDNPILTDSRDWIYLDNEHPIIPAPQSDYAEPVDEQFDLLLIRGYRKVLNDDTYSAYITINTLPPLQEGETVTFTLHTNKFDRGLVVPYQITGVHQENISTPKYGTVTLGQNGTATVTLTLLNNGPRTDSTKMNIEFLINGGTSLNLNYVIAANATYRLKAKAVTGINDIKVGSYTVGDTFMLCLSQHGLSGKVVRINSSFNNGSQQVTINGQVTTNGFVEVTMPADGSDLYIPVHCSQTASLTVDMLNFNISYNGVNLDWFGLPSSLLVFSVNYIELSTGQIIYEVKDNVPFTYRVQHNSNQQLAFTIQVTENTMGSEMSPVPTVIYSNFLGEATTGRLMVGRDNKMDPDRLTIRTTNPYLPTETRTITLTIPAEV
jgi:hypothetical protein